MFEGGEVGFTFATLQLWSECFKYLNKSWYSQLDAEFVKKIEPSEDIDTKEVSLFIVISFNVQWF